MSGLSLSSLNVVLYPSGESLRSGGAAKMQQLRNESLHEILPELASRLGLRPFLLGRP